MANRTSRKGKAPSWLFNSSSHDLSWLDWKAIAKRFPATGSTWGDVFLNDCIVDELRAEGRKDVAKLREVLEA